MAQTEKCAHPYCSCPAAEDSQYCSTICEESRETTEIFCDCGHADCEGGVDSAARRIA